VLEAVRPSPRMRCPSCRACPVHSVPRLTARSRPRIRENQRGADSSCGHICGTQIFIDNWRWEGVPFFLRTGKCMRRKLTQFVINFKPAPQLFHNVDGGDIRPRPNAWSSTYSPTKASACASKASSRPGPAHPVGRARLRLSPAIQRRTVRGLCDAAAGGHPRQPSRTTRSS